MHLVRGPSRTLGGREILQNLDRLRTGGPEEKEHAARTLAKLASDDAAKAQILDRWGVPLLIDTAREGYTEKCRDQAVLALANLAYDSAQSWTAIREADGIPTLVRIAASGTDKQREYAAFALCNLSDQDEANVQANLFDNGHVEYILGFGKNQRP